MYRDAWIAVDGVRLHLQDWEAPPPRPGAPGGGAGRPPLLLLHGLTQQSHVFDRVAARLAGRYRCLALDVRGRGESDWAPPDTYTIPRYVADVLGVLRALDLPAVHLLGTSMGGLIGLSLAATAPGALLSLGLNDVGPEIDPAGLARIRAQVGASPARFPDVEAAAAWTAAQEVPGRRPRSRAELLEALRWAVRPDPAGGVRWKFDPAVGAAARVDAGALAAAALTWWAGLAAVPGPVLLIRGAGSDILTPEAAAEMQRRRPDLVRVDVPGAGHPPTLDEPEAVAALERFYPATPQPPRAPRAPRTEPAWSRPASLPPTSWPTTRPG
jgi:pimeloyl-ACP methyl ester carboxylesterase